MENSKFLELKKQYGLTEEACDKPVSEEDLKLIPESHCDNLPTPLPESTDRITQRDQSQTEKDGSLSQCEDFRQPAETYRGLIMTLVKMGRSQVAEEVCQKLKDTTEDKPLPKAQGKLLCGHIECTTNS